MAWDINIAIFHGAASDLRTQTRVFFSIWPDYLSTLTPCLNSGFTAAASRVTGFPGMAHSGVAPHFPCPF